MNSPLAIVLVLPAPRLLSTKVDLSFNLREKSLKLELCSDKRLSICRKTLALWPLLIRIASASSLIVACRSILDAKPRSRSTPVRNSSAVRKPSPLSMRENTFSASAVSKPIDESHSFKTGWEHTLLNSAMSSLPSCLWSAHAKTCSRLLRSFSSCLRLSRTMTSLSWAAALNVSCMTAPLIIPTTAKPIVSLCRSAKITHHSERRYIITLTTGGQFANVISNTVRVAYEKVPKY
mmetsp:Transcript_9884/g.22115  ORF Transcript_9884/g.22115 Transcript_9884/m.22115 type:complete len:235 (-) Transcript_9884:1252-1956(-)